MRNRRSQSRRRDRACTPHRPRKAAPPRYSVQALSTCLAGASLARRWASPVSHPHTPSRCSAVWMLERGRPHPPTASHLAGTHLPFHPSPEEQKRLAATPLHARSRADVEQHEEAWTNQERRRSPDQKVCPWRFPKRQIQALPRLCATRPQLLERGAAVVLLLAWPLAPPWREGQATKKLSEAKRKAQECGGGYWINSNRRLLSITSGANQKSYVYGHGVSLPGATLRAMARPRLTYLNKRESKQ